MYNFILSHTRARQSVHLAPSHHLTICRENAKAMGFIFSYVRYRHPRRVAHRVAPLERYASSSLEGVASLGTCTAAPPLDRNTRTLSSP